MPYSPRVDLTCGALLLLAGLLACGGESDFTELEVAGNREVVDVSASLEALIGSGYAVGPLAVLAVIVAGGGGGAIVGVMWGLIGVGGTAAVVPYLRARRDRGSP